MWTACLTTRLRIRSSLGARRRRWLDTLQGGQYPTDVRRRESGGAATFYAQGRRSKPAGASLVWRR
jgi:hypothetical protein